MTGLDFHEVNVLATTIADLIAANILGGFKDEIRFVAFMPPKYELVDDDLHPRASYQRVTYRAFLIDTANLGNRLVSVQSTGVIHAYLSSDPNYREAFEYRLKSKLADALFEKIYEKAPERDTTHE
jgi:hypothetical protein